MNKSPKNNNKKNKVGGNRTIDDPLCLVNPCYVPMYCIYSIIYFFNIFDSIQ